MRTLIVGALEDELSGWNEQNGFEPEECAPLQCRRGRRGEHELVIAEVGVGKGHAAAGTALLIERYRPDRILHVGVAGGLKKGQEVGDIILAERLIYSDADVTPFGYEYGQIPRMPPFFAPDPGLLKTAEKALKKLGESFSKGLIVTQDAFVMHPEQQKILNERFPEALAIEMEGAAAAQAAFLLKVPFMEIRILSDTPGGKNRKKTFGVFMEQAASLIKRITETIIDEGAEAP